MNNYNVKIRDKVWGVNKLNLKGNVIGIVLKGYWVREFSNSTYGWDENKEKTLKIFGLRFG